MKSKSNHTTTNGLCSSESAMIQNNMCSIRSRIPLKESKLVFAPQKKNNFKTKFRTSAGLIALLTFSF